MKEDTLLDTLRYEVLGYFRMARWPDPISGNDVIKLLFRNKVVGSVIISSLEYTKESNPDDILKKTMKKLVHEFMESIVF